MARVSWKISGEWISSSGYRRRPRRGQRGSVGHYPGRPRTPLAKYPSTKPVVIPAAMENHQLLIYLITAVISFNVCHVFGFTPEYNVGIFAVSCFHRRLAVPSGSE